MITAHRGLLPLSTLCAALACGSDATGGACAGVVSLGIEVAIRDSASATPLAASATAVATEGAFADTLKPVGFDTTGALLVLGGVAERPGTYDLVIQVPGYVAWTQTGVKVRDGECGVKTVHLLARLQSEP